MSFCSLAVVFYFKGGIGEEGKGGKGKVGEVLKVYILGDEDQLCFFTELFCHLIAEQIHQLSSFLLFDFKGGIVGGGKRGRIKPLDVYLLSLVYLIIVWPFTVFYFLFTARRAVQGRKGKYERNESQLNATKKNTRRKRQKS